MIDFTCPQCGSHVQVKVEPVVYSDDRVMDRIEAYCCTAHAKPVRMLSVEPS